MALPRFKVELYAAWLENPRTLRTAPNGDIFLAESDPGRIRVFRGTHQRRQAGAIGDLRQRIEDIHTAWLFIRPDPIRNGCTWATRRGGSHSLSQRRPEGERTPAAYRRSIVEPAATGRERWNSRETARKCLSPSARLRTWTIPIPTPQRRIALTFWSSIPSCQCACTPTGIRNAGGGIAVNPQTGELWCSVNERDALGDNLVPDYITHVQEGGFYGWPWWYMGGHQDPRHEGKHPELKDKVIVPDVLLQPHNASLEFTFYDGKQFPAEYKGDIFASEHGSWNKSVRVGYEVIRVPLHQTGNASGEYEDFLTGFVLPDGHVWGRPVGITVAPDGSLLVSDDGSNSIWRVSYTGK